MKLISCTYLYKGMTPEESMIRLEKGLGKREWSFFSPSYPVARRTTSASNLDLSSNSIPPSQNHHFDAFLNNIFPFSASEKKFSGKIAIWQEA